MKDNIRFKGLSLNRDEQSAEHGELSLCGGIELHDGALRASIIDGTKIAGNNPLTYGGATLKLLYVHTNTGFTHYISGANNALYASKEVSGGWSTSVIADSGFPVSGIRSVTSVGNTLVVFNDSGLHYFLCKQNSNGDNWSYTYLGQKPPFLELQFGMIRDDTNERFNETCEISIPEGKGLFFKEDSSSWWRTTKDGRTFTRINDEINGDLTEQVMARVNERIYDITSKGLFYAPFLIRYCYRLFDGTSLIMHSPPVLMMPNLQRAVLNSVEKLGEYKESYSGRELMARNLAGTFNFYVFIMKSALYGYLRSSSSVIAELKNWRDIVKSVDIFITPQFSRIDTSKKIENAIINYDLDNYSLMGGSEFDIADLYKKTYPNSADDPDFYNWIGFEIPEYTEKDFFERIRNASTFFKVMSVNIDDITTVFTSSGKKLDIAPHLIQNITTNEQMTDDYKTHNEILPSDTGKGGLYVYNHRLNVYGISERLFEGFSPEVAFPYNTGGVSLGSIKTYINTPSGRLKFSKNGSWSVSEWLLNNGYFFYPDDRVDGISFVSSSYLTFERNKRMKASLTLNGSLTFMEGLVGWNELSQASNGNIVPITNKVYTSRADNPFYFPNLVGESGINSVGFGEVVGMAALTRALTQGAADDKSLAVFCTDGIWVLKVSPQGTYSEIKNKSRDVCVNPKSICQLDQSVIFASGRSLSRFVEQDVIPVSEILDGPYIKWSDLLPAFYGTFGTDGDNPDEIIKRLLDFGTPAVDVFRSGTVLYDYMGKRLIVFPQSAFASKDVALVYSIRDQAWSTMAIPQINAAIPGYPSPYVQYADGSVVCLDKAYGYDTENDHSGLVITRTLTYSESMDVIRGFRQLSDCEHQPVLFFFGSNDQRSWQQLGFSQRPYHNYMPGRPFRYFRIAIYFSKLKCSEEYQQLDLEIINKYTKL